MSYPRTSTHALRVAIALLYGGVAPIEPSGDACQKAPFHAAPATEREWLVVTFDVEDMRVRRHGDDMWIPVHDARWRADSLLAVGSPRWMSSHQLPADTLALAWSEIERIEKPAGTWAAVGAGVGAFAGLGVSFVVALIASSGHADLDGWGFVMMPFITVPLGAVVGAVIGSASARWAPFYCAPSANADTHDAHRR